MKTHKNIRLVTIITLLVIQVVFLTMIAKEKYEVGSFAILISVIIITVAIFFGYRYLDLHHEEYGYERIGVAIWVPIGAVLCYSLNIYGGLGSVLSAGITGTVASFIPVLNKDSIYIKKLPGAIYCGAFVGMSSAEITPSIGFVIAAGSLTGVLFMVSKNLFLGIGGKLGTLAFAGVAMVSLLYWLFI
ncbi:hypothetical protein [Psychroserpens sp. NJDZ02]|uniref:hypothetical protein n=1 Tax=Psychroserpens sp. NJDZ02 TaxID=2570561 RepID=UPI0010A81C55|nr:hypothetical protein [Psychroserpens sp. NJDZ02]QCE43003.1 hypothetical protein E9099_16795 [Psychroserpens sp. NJDZ02]